MPIASSRQAQGSKGWSRDASPGSTNVQFRLHWDDSALWKLIEKLGYEGPTELNRILGEVLEEKTQEVKKELRKMAGPLGSVVVPAWGRFRPSSNIYETVADSLNVFQVPGTTFHRVQSGSKKGDYIDGIKGSRDGLLAKIVAGGARSFSYPENLPALVRSSTAHYSRTGLAGDTSFGMRDKGKHPGFTRTYDYTMEIQSRVEDDWEEKAVEGIIRIAMRGGGI